MSVFSPTWGWAGCFALVAAPLAVLPAHAATFSATGLSLSGAAIGATANFRVEGNNLVVELANVGGGAIGSAVDLLTGFSFRIAGDPVLTPVSALLAPGASFANSERLDTPSTVDIGGEWGFTDDEPGRYTIATAGFLSGSQGFGGEPLTRPAAVLGPDFGLVNASYQDGEGGLLLSLLPLVRSSAVFTLSGLPTGFDITQIRGVSFQYGTLLGGNRLVSPVPDEIPEPAGTAGLLLFGAVMLRRRRRSV